MNPRLDFPNAAPAAFRAMLTLQQQADRSALAPLLLHLVKLRASQINGCAYCIALHVTQAEQASEAPQRLHLLPAWRESPGYDARERAALAWAEALAHLSDGTVSDEVHARARAQFSESELMWLSVAIANINAWNRLGAAYRFTPPVPKKVQAAA